jgi:uncharacterized protein YoxC
MVKIVPLALTTVASTSSIISHTYCNDEAYIGMQQLKRKLDAIDKERMQFKTQQKRVEDDVSTPAQSMAKVGSDILNIRQERVQLNQKHHKITSLLQQQMPGICDHPKWWVCMTLDGFGSHAPGLCSRHPQYLS